jgi:alpha-beta hydrolase superfamily lysophospholipase
MTSLRTYKCRRMHWRRSIVAVLLLALIALNGIAFMQAWAMTHFVPAGQRTPAIESLSLPQKAWTIVAGVTVPRPQNNSTPANFGLSYEIRRIDAAHGEWLEAWFVPSVPSHAVVLMFPGYATSKDTLLAPASALHDMGYDALLVDFRGSGGSSGSDTTLGVREADDVATSVAYARQTWSDEPIVLYGVSMGAATVLRAVAKDGVQPDALILESPFDRLLTTVGNRFHSMGLPAFPSAELLVFWGSLQHGFDGFQHNPVEYARWVKCPTLFMYGNQDPRVTPEQSIAIYEQLGGPKELVSFPGAGHTSLIAAAPQEWKAHVGKFLDQIGSGHD